MDGNILIGYIRHVLKDVTTAPSIVNALNSIPTPPYVPNSDHWVGTDRAGFWNDIEIILALNNAQDIIVNACIRNKLYHLINGLTQTTGITSHTPNNPISLPNDYLHYISGMVGIQGNLVTAKIYLGGEGVKFINSFRKHCGIHIFSGMYYYIHPQLSGQLFYYRRPSIITMNNTLPDFNIVDFSTNIYNCISDQAILLLAMKDIQTQRDIKIMRNNMMTLIKQPKILEYYIKNNEEPRFTVQQQQQQG